MQVQRDLIALPDVGMSVLEISHRSKTFEAILAQTEADVRALAEIPSEYAVLFLQGGASAGRQAAEGWVTVSNKRITHRQP